MTEAGRLHSNNRKQACKERKPAVFSFICARLRKTNDRQTDILYDTAFGYWSPGRCRVKAKEAVMLPVLFPASRVTSLSRSALTLLLVGVTELIYLSPVQPLSVSLAV